MKKGPGEIRPPRKEIHAALLRQVPVQESFHNVLPQARVETPAFLRGELPDLVLARTGFVSHLHEELPATALLQVLLDQTENSVPQIVRGAVEAVRCVLYRLLPVPGPPCYSRRYCIRPFEADYRRSSSGVAHDETLGVYRELHSAIPAGVPRRHDTDGPLDVLGSNRYLKADSSAAYLYRNLNHLNHLSSLLTLAAIRHLL